MPPDFWDGAELVVPVPKRAISLRVDEDVLEWFRGLGPRYQTRMNAVLAFRDMDDVSNRFCNADADGL